MTDPIDLLRAHDPERAGAPAPPIEALLARLDDEPPPRSPSRGEEAGATGAHAAGARRRRRLARRMLALALPSLAVAVALFVVLGAGGGRTDVIAAARAAVAPEGAIVHVRWRTTIEQPDGRPVEMVMQGPHGRAVGLGSGPVDRWSASSTRRWREVERLLPDRRRRMPGGTREQAFAGGILTTRDWILTTRDYWTSRARTQRVRPETHPLRRGAADRALLTGTTDPLALVRQLLDSGEAREAGETTRGGRRLLRLVSEFPGRDLGRRGWMSGLRTTYLLDAESYAPVEVERVPLPAPGQRTPAGQIAGPTWRTVFEAYERLPLTAANERLLRFGGPTR
jgi:hypothetical protein